MPGRACSERLERHQGWRNPGGLHPHDAGSLYRLPAVAAGTKWKTLDDVELVSVATVDSKDASEVEVYLFPADEVRQRFNAASYAARAKDGQSIKDNELGVGSTAMIAASPPVSARASSNTTNPSASMRSPICSPSNPSADDEEPGQAADEILALPTLSTIADVMAGNAPRRAQPAGVCGPKR